MQRASLIEDVGGEVPFGLCAEAACTGEAARSIVRFPAWHMDLHQGVKTFIAQPSCLAVCRTCFEKGAN